CKPGEVAGDDGEHDESGRDSESVSVALERANPFVAHGTGEALFMRPLGSERDSTRLGVSATTLRVELGVADRREARFGFAGAERVGFAALGFLALAGFSIGLGSLLGEARLFGAVANLFGFVLDALVFEAHELVEGEEDGAFLSI